MCVSTGARWEKVQILEEEICDAIYDALPQDYKTHINYNTNVDWQEMDDQEFLDIMMSYERLDNARRLKSEQEKERRDLLSKRHRRFNHTKSGRKRPTAKISSGTKPSGKDKKFCQICKDNNGKYWTHDTADCFFKKPQREANTIETVHKEIDDLKDLIKDLKKKVDSDSDSD